MSYPFLPQIKFLIDTGTCHHTDYNSINFIYFKNFLKIIFQTDLDIKGNLEVSLSYRLPETLKITIHSASELVCRNPDKMPHPYVKVVVPGVQKVDHTKIIKGTLEPVWGEEFEYTVPQEELENR